MEYEGREPRADNWKTHVIKWGDGCDRCGTYVGEKQDQAFFYEVDHDGDIDIVASCEKYGPNDSHAGDGRGRVSDLSSERTFKAIIQMRLP